jgi:hypothetical protein
MASSSEPIVCSFSWRSAETRHRAPLLCCPSSYHEPVVGLQRHDPSSVPIQLRSRACLTLTFLPGGGSTGCPTRSVQGPASFARRSRPASTSAWACSYSSRRPLSRTLRSTFSRRHVWDPKALGGPTVRADAEQLRDALGEGGSPSPRSSDLAWRTKLDHLDRGLERVFPPSFALGQAGQSSGFEGTAQHIECLARLRGAGRPRRRSFRPGRGPAASPSGRGAGLRGRKLRAVDEQHRLYFLGRRVERCTLSGPAASLSLADLPGLITATQHVISFIRPPASASPLGCEPWSKCS